MGPCQAFEAHETELVEERVRPLAMIGGSVLALVAPPSLRPQSHPYPPVEIREEVHYIAHGVVVAPPAQQRVGWSSTITDKEVGAWRRVRARTPSLNLARALGMGRRNLPRNEKPKNSNPSLAATMPDLASATSSPMSDRVFACQGCGLIADRDTNATANLAAWGEGEYSSRTQAPDPEATVELLPRPPIRGRSRNRSPHQRPEPDTRVVSR